MSAHEKYQQDSEIHNTHIGYTKSVNAKAN